MSENTKPFDTAFVMNITAKHCISSVDHSIRKTFERTNDFPSGSEKSAEVFNTLSALHAFRKLIEDFRENNPMLFERQSQVNYANKDEEGK